MQMAAIKNRYVQFIVVLNMHGEKNREFLKHYGLVFS